MTNTPFGRAELHQAADEPLNLGPADDVAGAIALRLDKHAVELQPVLGIHPVDAAAEA